MGLAHLACNVKVLCTGAPKVLCTGAPKLMCTSAPKVLCNGALNCYPIEQFFTKSLSPETPLYKMKSNRRPLRLTASTRIKLTFYNGSTKISECIKYAKNNEKSIAAYVVGICYGVPWIL